MQYQSTVVRVFIGAKTYHFAPTFDRFLTRCLSCVSTPSPCSSLTPPSCSCATATCHRHPLPRHPPLLMLAVPFMWLIRSRPCPCLPSLQQFSTVSSQPPPPRLPPLTRSRLSFIREAALVRNRSPNVPVVSWSPPSPLSLTPHSSPPCLRAAQRALASRECHFHPVHPAPSSFPYPPPSLTLLLPLPSSCRCAGAVVIPRVRFEIKTSGAAAFGALPSCSP